jgi:hypothetical protein
MDRLPSSSQIKKSGVIDLPVSNKTRREAKFAGHFYSSQAGQIELSLRTNLSASLWASRLVAKE